MKVAVLSDIHGNYSAFKQVLKKIEHEKVKHILILGDIVGYYYSPQKILESLSDWKYDMIKGNHEDILGNLISNPILHDAIRSKYGSGHQHALNKLDNKTIISLINLPSKKTVIIDGVSFGLNHGTPWDSNEYLYPDADVKKINRCDSIDHDFVLIGHTHYSFTHQCKNSILINPGSVGQSREKGGYAYWAIINTEDKSYHIKKTKYNTTSLVEEINKFDPDINYNLKILTR